MSQEERLDRALAHRYAPQKPDLGQAFNDLVCTHADRSAGEHICESCRAETNALLANEHTTQAQAALDAVFTAAVTHAVEHFAPNLAVLEESSGRFYGLRDRARVLCVHDKPTRTGERCTHCDVMAYRLNQVGNQ